MRRLNILLSAYACEPGKGSEPEVGWQWALQIARFHDITVITRSNNRMKIEEGLSNLSPGTPFPRFIYHDEPPWCLKLKQQFKLHRIYYLRWQKGARDVIAALARQHRYDLVHHLTFVSFRYPTAIWGHGIPAIWGPVAGMESVPWKLLPFRSASGLIYELARNTSNAFGRLMDGRIVKRAQDSAAVLAATQETAEAFARRGISTRLFQAIGITGESISRHSIPIPKGPLRLLYVGGFLPLKGIDLGIQALKASDGDATLTLIGDGPDRRELEALVHRLGLEDRVFFLGKKPREEVMLAYSDYHVFLFPSLHDSGGFALIEAMSQGLPSICLRCGGPRIIVEDDCGITLPIGTRSEVIEGMANAINHYNLDREMVARHGRKARQRIADTYDWDKVGERINQIYREVSGQ